MQSFLYSYYRPIFLALLVLLGLAAGHAFDTAMQMTLQPPSGDAAATPAPRAVRMPAKTSDADLDAILQNNIFDAANRSPDATMGFVASAGQGAARTARTDLKLVGTVVRGDKSFALVEVGKELKLVHLGEEVPGGGKVESVERFAVGIRNRDRSLTTLELREQGPSGGRVERTATAPSQAAGGAIREVGENRWMVSQTMVDAVRENFASQLSLAQMQPRQVNGKTEGFMIQRIYPQSILNKMGLKRGDVVIDVNSIRLDSPEKALQVFQQLREARRVTVAVERNGQPLSFVYEIE